MNHRGESDMNYQSNTLKIYIYGTGGTAEQFYLYRMNPETKVLGFLDGESSKYGEKVPFAESYVIQSIDEMEKDYDVIIIAASYVEIYDRLIKKGILEDKLFFLNDSASNKLLNDNLEKRYQILKKVLKKDNISTIAHIKNFVPLGNYSSAVVDLQLVENNEEKILNRKFPVESGIDLCINEQMELLNKFNQQGDILPYTFLKQNDLRYYGDNGWFPISTAHLLSHIVYEFESKQIIEVGSGFSSAVMLDLNEKKLEHSINLTFIEPYADRLKSLLKQEDKILLIEKNLQEVDLDIFRQLNKGDILFIDSSHVVKTGNDVNYILFEILPVLKSGVIIHFHDIFFPFEYPKEWIYQGRGWNEAYVLRAFLQYNDSFKIVFWDDCLYHYITTNISESGKKISTKYVQGGSIFIQKV